MNLEERLRNHCDRRERAQAESLAKAVLKNEPIWEVGINETHVHVDTPRFRGVHRLRTDRQGTVDVHLEGDYTYKSDSVELSFSTATMNQRAYDRAQAHLAVRNSADPQAVDDGQTPSDESSPFEPDATTAAERRSVSPVRFLKGLL